LPFEAVASVGAVFTDLRFCFTRGLSNGSLSMSTVGINTGCGRGFECRDEDERNSLLPLRMALSSMLSKA